MDNQPHEMTAAERRQAEIDAQIAKASQEEAVRLENDEAASKPKEPESLENQFGRRRDNLRDTLAAVRKRDWVRLPELSRRSLSGHPIDLRVRRLSIQELAASDLLPTRSAKLVSEIIARGQSATMQARVAAGLPQEQLMTSDDIEDVIHDLYGGWTREAYAAFIEFRNAICCSVVVDEQYRFYMTMDEVEQDPKRGVYVWEIPDDDLNAIYAWSMEQEQAAEASILPFRYGGTTDSPVPSGEKRVPASFGPDSV